MHPGREHAKTTKSGGCELNVSKLSGSPSPQHWQMPISIGNILPILLHPHFLLNNIENLDFDLQAVDIYLLKETVVIHRTGNVSVAEAILQHGYIGNVVLTPSIAISLSILEMDQCIRLRKALFSVETFTKVICDLYSVITLATAHFLYGI